MNNENAYGAAQTANDSFDLCSDEVILSIFLFLDADKLSALSLISIRFRRLANDNSLWSRFVCESSDVTSELSVREFLKKHPNHISSKYLSISIFRDAYKSYQAKLAEQRMDSNVDDGPKVCASVSMKLNHS